MEFQCSYFKSWKMMLWTCCTQYTSKFGNLSSSHRTGKDPFSFQSQRKAMSKNIQTTTQLNSFPMPVRWCSKSSKLGFNSKWTKNFQMCQLDLEKAEEPEIKLSTSIGSWKRQENSRKLLDCFIDCAKAFDSVDFNKLWKILKNMIIPEYFNCLLRNT